MNHPVLRSVGRALPTNYYPQEILTTALWNEWSGKIEDRALFDRLHRSVFVRGRHLALPMDEYQGIDSFGKTNDKWIERAR
jgi:alkylresorcinol/alkylpyrone synthase